jgi:hypothetical protein
VLEWCERGRGLRPDWAVKGLEFLYFAANPSFTKAGGVIQTFNRGPFTLQLALNKIKKIK